MDDDIRPSAALDDEFVSVMKEVEAVFHTLSKQHRLRCELWAKKLCQVQTSRALQTNRNAYADLLLYCILAEDWRSPFDQAPQGASLETLPWLSERVIFMARQRRVEAVEKLRKDREAGRRVQNTSSSMAPWGTSASRAADLEESGANPSFVQPADGVDTSGGPSRPNNVLLKMELPRGPEQIDMQQYKWVSIRSASLELENQRLLRQLRLSQRQVNQAKRNAEDAAMRGEAAIENEKEARDRLGVAEKVEQEARHRTKLAKEFAEKATKAESHAKIRVATEKAAMRAAIAEDNARNRADVQRKRDMTEKALGEVLT